MLFKDTVVKRPARRSDTMTRVERGRTRVRGRDRAGRKDDEEEVSNARDER
jgi:hypothetical protein